MSGSSKAGCGEYPCAASAAEYGSTVRDGIANPVPAYLRYRVTSGARTPSG